jgi:hypothetical protein
VIAFNGVFARFIVVFLLEIYSNNILKSFIFYIKIILKLILKISKPIKNIIQNAIAINSVIVEGGTPSDVLCFFFFIWALHYNSSSNEFLNLFKFKL